MINIWESPGKAGGLSMINWLRDYILLLTNRFELHLRDKLAYRLQLQLPKLQVLRVWNNVDISIHQNNQIRSLIELKYSPAAYIVRRSNIKKSGPLMGLLKDYKKRPKRNSNWHGILFFSCPKNVISEKFKNQVQGFSSLNKYVDYYESERQWRVNIKKLIADNFFPESKFQIKSDTHNIGSWFDTQVDLIWFLISRK